MRNLNFSEGEFYHIYNRGTDSRDIFLDEQDRTRFIKLLFVANGTNSFVFRDLPMGVVYKKFERGSAITAIGAYCLMTNHFHILLKEKKEGGISDFMRKVQTSYSSYFNKKYKRTGHLFEGRFKAKHLDSDEYLKYIFSYIHLNPIKIIDSKWKENGITDKKKAQDYLLIYPYSSYHEYSSDKPRLESLILNKEEFPEYFSNHYDFKDYISDWLNYSNT